MHPTPGLLHLPFEGELVGTTPSHPVSFSSDNLRTPSVPHPDLRVYLDMAWSQAELPGPHALLSSVLAEEPPLPPNWASTLTSYGL